MAPNGILADVKSIAEDKLQSKFGLIRQGSEIESYICIENQKRRKIVWKFTIPRLFKDGKCQKFISLDKDRKKYEKCQKLTSLDKDRKKLL